MKNVPRHVQQKIGESKQYTMPDSKHNNITWHILGAPVKEKPVTKIPQAHQSHQQALRGPKKIRNSNVLSPLSKFFG
jgi:hypothetical protein